MNQNRPQGGPFPRDARLTEAADFQRVFRDGQRSRDRFFTVLFCENGRSEPRLGLAISKRRVRKATGRNRLKRLVRESFRAAELPALDLVVMAGEAAGAADNLALFRSLDGHWQHITRKGHKEGLNG